MERTPKPQTSAVPETGIEDLRKLVLAIGDDVPKTAALKALMSAQLEAAKSKSLQTEVLNRYDETVTFAAFIEQEVKRRQGRAA